MMIKTTIAVLFGGCSNEYEVSLHSACSVIDNLDPQNYHVILLGITHQGKWLKYSGDIDPIQNDTWEDHPSCIPAVIYPDRNTHGILVLGKDKVTAIPIDMAFPVLHGKNGKLYNRNGEEVVFLANDYQGKKGNDVTQ